MSFNLRTHLASFASPRQRLLQLQEAPPSEAAPLSRSRPPRNGSSDSVSWMNEKAEGELLLEGELTVNESHMLRSHPPRHHRQEKTRHAAKNVGVIL